MNAFSSWSTILLNLKTSGEYFNGLPVDNTVKLICHDKVMIFTHFPLLTQELNLCCQNNIKFCRIFCCKFVLGASYKKLKDTLLLGGMRSCRLCSSRDNQCSTALVQQQIHSTVCAVRVCARRLFIPKVIQHRQYVYT